MIEFERPPPRLSGENRDNTSTEAGAKGFNWRGTVFRLRNLERNYDDCGLATGGRAIPCRSSCLTMRYFCRLIRGNAGGTPQLPSQACPIESPEHRER